jgi:7-cyano-7-deazaguanine synthase
MRKEVLLFSGGIDSTILLFKLLREGKDLVLLFVNYGQKYAEQERKTTLEIATEASRAFKHAVIELKEMDLDCGKMYDGFVPNRNLTLCSLAATTLGADVIYLSGVADDNAVDKNETANNEMSALISKYCDKEVSVQSPLLTMTKGEAVAWFKKSFDGNILLMAYSCYNGEPCYDCEACYRRWVALVSNGIMPPNTLSDAICDQYLSKLHKYHPDRISRTLIALRHKYGKIIATDMDGVLCEEGKSHSDYATRKAKATQIIHFNKQIGLKAIYTSRLEADRELTMEWLADNGVKYDCLFMNKIPYDIFYEDKCVKV